jgi:hypothetical protein
VANVRPCLVLLFVLLACAARGGADVVFSSFGPGTTWASSGVAVSQAWAVEFTPATAHTLSAIRLPLYGPSGAQATVTLRADADGLPGAVLEEFLVPFDCCGEKLYVLTSAQQIELQPGAPYWLTVWSEDEWASWLWSPAEAAVRYTFTREPGPGDDPSDWVDVVTSVGPAFQVEGERVGARVPIDVRPDAIQPRSQGMLTVAVLSGVVDVTTIAPESIRFGRTGHEAAPATLALENVDGDGFVDLVLHFRVQGAGIRCGDTSVRLTAATVAGEPLQGTDSIRTVGCQ